MDKLLGFLIVTEFLISINLIGAGIVFLLGKAVLHIYPNADDVPGIGYFIGSVALGFAIMYAMWTPKIFNLALNRTLEFWSALRK